MKQTNKLAALLLAAVTILMAVSLTSCAPEHLSSNKKDSEISNSDTLATEPKTSPYIALSVSPVTVATTANTTVLKQTLTATVIPVTAANKQVDWSIAWADSKNTRNVTDYVTVTTRDSAFRTQCIVSYVGKPTDVVFTGNLTATSGLYRVAPEGSYTFNVSLTNPIGTVGEQFDDIEVSVGAVGSVILGYREYYTMSDTEKWYEASNVTVELKTLTDKFISATYNNGVLTVNTLGAIEDYYESMQRLDGGRTRAYKNQFRSYVNDCYFTVTITEKTSGLSETIKFRIDNTAVSGISLDHDRMSF